MKKDIDRLQGIWNIVSLEMDGRTVPTGALGGASIAVDGDRFISNGMGAAYEGTIELNSSATPKTFDLKFTTGPEKGNTNPGIYELGAKQWRLCIATRGTVRPRAFTAKPGTGIVVEVLERQEPAKAQPVNDWIDDAGFLPEPDFEGEWTMISGFFNGMPFDENFVRGARRVVEGCDITVTFGAEVYSKAKYTVDRSATPFAIDIHNKSGMHARKMQRGIYEVKGKILRLSLAVPGRDRPRDFSASSGDGRTVVVWKKALS